MLAPFAASDSAMLLIDHQVGTMQLIKNLPLDRVRANTLALAKTAKILGLPIVLTSSQEEMLQGPLIPELVALLPEENKVRVKRAGIADAWSDRNFVRAVEATGRRNLIMAGVTTDVCLVFPAINAVAAGYNVQAVMDASGSPYEVSEELARRRMAANGVVLTATVTIIAELAQDWSRPEGEKLKGVLFSDVLPKIG
ncbi:MAG: isochorismatase family protein [Phycisphaerales bacterium]|nr:isochorismatase family protein [Phycisphaerales bacterium]